MASRPPAAAGSAQGDQAYVQPFAAWRVSLDGQDITARFNPRLVSLRLSEKLGESADQLEIVIEDALGEVALPAADALLVVSLGWARGTGVVPGLTAKGSFRVDEVSWDGPPDKITIRARSADLKDSFRTRKSKIWKATTLGGIVGTIAAAHGLTPRCHPDLAATAVTLAEQANKSDMTFLRDLGRRYDAVATVKAGALIFAPHNAATTATGKPIPSLTLTRQSGDRYSYSRAERERAQDGAEAQFHDQDAAERKKVAKGGAKRRRLKRVYASEADAGHAAQSETNRAKRAAGKLECTLAYGDPAVAAGVRVTAKGFKTEIDALAWRVASVEHSMDGSGGYTTRLEMEVAG
jgi:uncharacterized protein